MRESKTGIVGRQAERDLIAKALENALGSKGQMAIISGEAGIGKSTITGFLEEKAESEGMTVCVGDCTLQDAGIPYQGFQRALCNLTDESLFSLEEFAYFDEIFLISKIGLLISHVSRTKDEGMDEDILGSMLTAVQDFVKDSFGGGEVEGQKGGLGKLEYLDTKIIMEHGDLIYMAVVTSGEEHPDMKKDIKKCLTDIESTYFDVLMDWDGDLDSLSGSVDMLHSLADSKYRVKRSLENINITAERLKVQNRIHEIIEANAKDSGLLLVLEDIHWADESTILAIPFIARNIVDNKVILCMTYRPEDIEDNLELKSVIDGLKTAIGCVDISMDSLDEETLDALVCSLLDGGNPPDELMVNLKAETSGNPFFIIEAVRALIAEGTLLKDKDVWILKHGQKSAIPHSVVELVSRRLETLELDCLRFVEYGAILGRRFSMPLLCSGFKMEEDYISEIIEQLVSLNIFDRAGQDELMFQHSKIQEVIYSGMSERWKRMLHRNAGQTIEYLNRDNVEDVLFSLAYHFSRTLKYEKGIDYCISAGYKASNNFAPREAAQFFETAIGIIDTSEREDDRYLEINEIMGELYELDGNYEKALSIFGRILEISEDKFHRSTVLMMKGRVFQSQSNYDEAIASYEKGITLAEALDSSLLKAKINGYLGKIYLRKGEYDKALDLQRTYLTESQKVGDNREIGQAYMNLGGVYWFMNDQQMAIRQWGESLNVFSKDKYSQGIANVNDNLGVGYSTIGNFEKSLEYYKSSEEIMTKIGDVRGMSMVLLNIGVLYNRMGQYEKALEYNMKSLQIKKKIGDIVGVANIYNNIGGNYQDLERYDEAVEYFKQNYALMEESGDIWGVARSLNNMAESEIELGRISEARDHCKRSLELGIKHSLNDIQSYAYLLNGVIASHDGDYELADKHFEKGLELGKKTEDPFRIGMAYLYMAKSFVKREEHEIALDYYAETFKVFEDAKMETLAKRTREEMQSIIDGN